MKSIKMDRHRNNVQDSKTSLDSWTFDSRKSKLENNPRLLLRRVEDLNFSLRCNYVEKNLALLPHAEYFFLLKTMYYHNQVQNITLRNNKDIFVGERPFFIRKWYKDEIAKPNNIGPYSETVTLGLKMQPSAYGVGH